MPPTNSSRRVHGRTFPAEPSRLTLGVDEKAIMTRASRKKWPSGGLGKFGSPGNSSTTQKKAQMASDMNPRTLPSGSPNGWRGSPIGSRVGTVDMSASGSEGQWPS